MKHNLKYLLYSITIITMLAACAPDEDDDLIIDDRDKFTGTWTCNDNGSTSGTSTYTVVVERVGELDSVRIKNFYFLGNANAVTGKVSGNSISLPKQTSDGININGSGSFSNNGFSITYTAIDGSVVDNGTAVYSK